MSAQFRIIQNEWSLSCYFRYCIISLSIQEKIYFTEKGQLIKKISIPFQEGA